jgi:hypothetical protein
VGSSLVGAASLFWAGVEVTGGSDVGAEGCSVCSAVAGAGAGASSDIVLAVEVGVLSGRLVLRVGRVAALERATSTRAE